MQGRCMFARTGVVGVRRPHGGGDRGCGKDAGAPRRRTYVGTAVAGRQGPSGRAVSRPDFSRGRGRRPPPIAAPARGATQNSQSWDRAQPPTKRAGPVLRAGLTDVLVTGMLIRWIRASANPMARGANPAGARPSVAPRMTIRKKAVRTTSAIKALTSE